MIRLTRLNKTIFVLNSDLIESFESKPDTIITLASGKKYVVCESVDEVIDKVMQFKAGILKYANEN
ncbi:flagellar FlbD family protein [Ruminiclostridium cellulolyticum]|uniref:Flagellar FlbD family protein n=1 Tax=Ruminiclostridium cellulolyticum (strain ATCC 35319 / DSM 5812 / JCM 6584 / H10) TaxID=394503 RepID=B8I3P4_RUMCH|nr:flagellar FlbD family protein [Ruminiclostridium cellulolyticum]ACL76387.1 flagellar FlbD family protein [Ruminiclostridium cellulolyticum H10]